MVSPFGMPGRSGSLLSNVVPQAGISYDLTRFSHVGSAGSAANALWLHRRTGISSLAELKKAKPGHRHRRAERRARKTPSHHGCLRPTKAGR